MANGQKGTFATQQGLQKMQEELDFLVITKRKDIVEKIKTARAHGDLSENSEYAAAKDEQAFVESRIQQLEEMIRNAKIITVDDQNKDMATIGKTVVFQELPDGDKETYTIVGSMESDPLNGKISNDSPMAQAILGRQVGDKVKVNTPEGEMILKILDIQV